MREFNNRVYRLLTYGLKDILLFFTKAFIILLAYTWWIIYRSDMRRGVIIVVVWILLATLITYIHKNKIIYIPPKPRKKIKQKQEIISKQDEEYKPFVMNVDESAFNNFTFNDYVVDTFKKQDSNQILDLLADKNKLILEELKQ